jgi:hypothetical protein
MSGKLSTRARSEKSDGNRHACTWAAFALMLFVAPAGAQDGLPQAEVAALPHISETGDFTTERPKSGGALGPARDFRVLWADPAVRNFVGMSENGWDFNKPDTIPGFGAVPE